MKILIPYPLVLMLLIAGAYSSALFFLPKDVFCATDCGNKFIQVQHIDRYGSMDIHYPAKKLDPEFKYFPYCAHHFKKLGNKIYSFYPFYFPVISAPFYKLFGAAGLYILPLAASLLCFVVMFFMMKKLGMEKAFPNAALIMAVCSPMFYYSLVFWEETPAVFLFALGTFFAIKALKHKKHGALFLFVGGSFLGLSTVLREEGYALMIASFFAFALCSRNNRKRAWLIPIGWLVAMVPLWIFQYSVYGNFMGIHASGYNALQDSGGIISAIWEKLGNFYFYIFMSWPFIYGTFAALSLILTIAVFSATFIKPARRWIVLPGLFIFSIGSAIFAYLIIASAQPVFNLLFTQALLPQTPFLFPVFLAIRPLMKTRNRGAKFMLILSLAYIFCACLALNRRDIGLIWGPRHFLFLFPLLVPLALYSCRLLLKEEKSKWGKKSLIFLFGLLIAISASIQTWGIQLLSIEKNSAREMLSAFKATKENVIITDIYWLPEQVAAVYFDKKFLMVDKKNTLSGAIELLRKNKVNNFALALSKSYRAISNEDMANAMKSVRITSSKTVSPPKMEFMKFHILSCVQSSKKD